MSRIANGTLPTAHHASVCLATANASAREKSLLPVTHWEKWRSFPKSFLNEPSHTTLKGVDRRFHHGELSVSRLIYRLHSKGFSLATFSADIHMAAIAIECFWEDFAWLITALSREKVSNQINLIA
jgi:hypothetical protein